MRRKVYLSGPIERVDDPETWRDEIEGEYENIEFINPCNWNLDSWEDRFELVWKELSIIRKVDFLFVNYIKEVETYGTPMEMLWAFMNNTPVVTWSLHEPEYMPVYSVMFSDFIHDDAEECIRKGWEFNSH